MLSVPLLTVSLAEHRLFCFRNKSVILLTLLKEAAVHTLDYRKYPSFEME